MSTRYIDPVTFAPGIEILGQKYSLEMYQDLAAIIGKDPIGELLLIEKDIMEILV